MYKCVHIYTLIINTRIHALSQSITHCRLTRMIALILYVCTFLFPLHHTATYCNTLHHTATHYKTLQHTATHCNTFHHTTTHCNTLQHTATHCNTLQHTPTHCNTLQHSYYIDYLFHVGAPPPGLSDGHNRRQARWRRRDALDSMRTSPR